VQVTAALGDKKGASDVFRILETQLAADSGPSLPWDRRVSLAIVLAEARRFDLARKQLEECLAEIDEPRLRSLSGMSVYRFSALTKALGLTISDPQLRKLAQNLLPPELRGER
jgi:hypothetical protein